MRLRLVWLLAPALGSASFALPDFFPLEPGSVRFAVIGDNGTGKAPQHEVGAMMVQTRERFPFEFVLMLGDNLYGGEKPGDYVRKFKRPYQPLLDAGVRFHAVLGNHDDDPQRFYDGFHMGGRRYYSFARGPVRFFALDSNRLDPAQLQWLGEALADSQERWKVCYLHHPLYSSGRSHGPDRKLRSVLEPVLVKHGVDVCFAGHEHFYERLQPQNGVHHFISGAAGQLRRGNIRPDGQTARGYDQDRHFMIVEIAGDTLYFQAVSRTGEVIDSGIIRK
ncbi:MAG: metallophosphoesterase [Acidobacteriota bacterium]